MDANNFGFSVTAPDLSYSSFPYIPEKLQGQSPFDSRNSPCSPFSTHFDAEICSSMDNFSESNSSLFYNDYLHQQPDPFRSLESAFSRSATPFSLQNQSIRHALLELETALMAPDFDEEVTKSETFCGENVLNQTSDQMSTTQYWNQAVLSPPSQFSSSAGETHFQNLVNDGEDTSLLRDFNPSYLRHLLISCATAFSKNNLSEFENLVELARASVSVNGEPIQRVGAYVLEGLIARKELSGTRIYRSLRCNEPDSKDLMSYMHALYQVCPYVKFGYMAANGAIAEACKNENRVHIIDFQIAQGTQWMTLLQALAARPCGVPLVRITGIDDPVSKYARGDSLALVGKRLAAISEKFNIPVEFNAVPVFAPDLRKGMLDVRRGEALVVNFPLQLHHIPDESVDISNPRDRLIRMVKSLSPKVVTLVEQESNTNTTHFMGRFVETLDYYSAMFESIDVTMPRDKKERISLEEHCLARDMVNIIACEGKDRVERHELLQKWGMRFSMAGFRPYPLSSYVNSVIGGLMRCYSTHYTLVEKDGGMLLGWKDKNLVSASAWH